MLLVSLCSLVVYGYGIRSPSHKFIVYNIKFPSRDTSVYIAWRLLDYLVGYSNDTLGNLLYDVVEYNETLIDIDKSCFVNTTTGYTIDFYRVINGRRKILYIVAIYPNHICFFNIYTLSHLQVYRISDAEAINNGLSILRSVLEITGFYRGDIEITFHNISVSASITSGDKDIVLIKTVRYNITVNKTLYRSSYIQFTGNGVVASLCIPFLNISIEYRRPVIEVSEPEAILANAYSNTVDEVRSVVYSALVNGSVRYYGLTYNMYYSSFKKTLIQTPIHVYEILLDSSWRGYRGWFLDIVVGESGEYEIVSIHYTPSLDTTYRNYTLVDSSKVIDYIEGRSYRERVYRCSIALAFTTIAVLLITIILVDRVFKR